ncbi:deoxyribodipyrimidine photo-lyase, partial [Amylibacter sp.]|nr:deoxyribodipyrimidine photo-lyase [Amylibacter sp.]
MTQAPIIVWFRRDFRFSDQEALSAAHSTGRPIIPVFIFDEVFEVLGAAPKWRLGLAIECFKKKLERMGSSLILRRGNACEILQELVNETGALDVYWSRAYDPASI